MKLERIVHLLEILGNPHNAFRSIHVGGTSGKGSTATMIASMLTSAGYQTGLYLSPHLQIMNECYQINNRMAATGDLVEVFEAMKPAIAQVARENPFGCPSYFEAQTALAFCLFRWKKVDVAVIEVGLGGVLDATNVLHSQISVLTNVALDHTEILGNTIELIAQKKAGIIKPGQLVVSGLMQPSTQQIVEERCALQGATLWQLGSQFTCQQTGSAETFQVVFPDTIYDDIRLNLRGDFQTANAACAIAAVHAFAGGVSGAVVRAGLRQTAIPGRLECVQENPTVILDGAHNPAKIRAAAEAITKYYGNMRRVVIVSLKPDKAYRDILPALVVNASVLIVTAFGKNELWEACDPAILAQAASEIAPGLDIRIEPDPMQALRQALAETRPDDLVWVTGSLYLIGDIREYWHPTDELLVQIEESAVLCN
ncbi:MAG: bifunctional folylpolyglutamate synthase/dihydrofolate synthase [Chloroflexi bacterium]|nr:bifunctional folylpolyglutamate synthase/dihydrofolate synthase [Chloroflexota bacterium]